MQTIEEISAQFLKNPTEEIGSKLVSSLRCSNLHNLNIMIGSSIIKLFPHNINIRSEVGISAYYNGNYDLSYDLYSDNLNFSNLTEQEAFQQRFNRHFSIDHISNKYVHYNPDIVSQLCANKSTNKLSLITFTITSCKRFDLFQQTINSFLNCCVDIDKIDEWLCVDDNSSQEDRDKMQQLYPFFKFYWKTVEEKGHPQSMNIIRNKVKTPYIFHIEDDWKFFAKKHYISNCMEVLSENNKIGQCLINKNYTETSVDISVPGGMFNTTRGGTRYFIHEFTPDKKSQEEFNKKHNNSRNSSYWPHFSFRPSLLRRSILEQLGSYNEKVSHFEMEYSYRYINAGFISAFLDDIYCIHIGRLTSQRYDKTIPNAYDLNDEAQLGGKEQRLNKKTNHIKLSPKYNIKTHVINLDTRPDRMISFNENCPIKYERFSAIFGKNLEPTSQLQQIFEKNDYNMRGGMVGCALSHIQLAINLTKSSTEVIFCNLEDDVTFVPEFSKKVEHILENAKGVDWDIIYLGHFLYPVYKNEDVFNKEKFPSIEKWNVRTSLGKSMGGTIGYLITKKGAEKLLSFINNTSMTNGIDTVQQKAADVMNIYYAYPHLVYSECALPGVQVNSDIQYDTSSLTISYEKRIELEKEFYGEYIESTNINDILFDDKNLVIFYNGDTKLNIPDNLNIKSYYVGKTLIIVSNPTEKQLNGRYFDRLKKNGEWDISDAIKLKA